MDEIAKHQAFGDREFKSDKGTERGGIMVNKLDAEDSRYEFPLTGLVDDTAHAADGAEATAAAEYCTSSEWAVLRAGSKLKVMPTHRSLLVLMSACHHQ